MSSSLSAHERSVIETMIKLNPATITVVTRNNCSCIGYCFQDHLQLDSPWFA